MAVSLATLKQMPPAHHQIGPYQVLGSLGKGGMSEVYKVEHRHLGQIRALKVLLPEIAARADIVERLLSEARAMAGLRHPAIVEVYDCDVLSDGTAFIAMEHLQGEPLRLWAERVGKLARQPRLAAAIVGRIAEGLAFAHKQAVVHRDLKPENVFLVRAPGDRDAFSVKVLDFGVAKMLRDERRTPTLDGCVIGTPVCMAPEQWRPGTAIDHRADIYALGCLFFELLCGRPPFIESEDIALMHAHLETTPPTPRSLEPSLSAGLDALVSRMLAKSPADRPQSLEEVLVELEALIGRPRAEWGALLRTPPGCPVIVQEAIASATTQPARSVARSPARARTPPLPSNWGRTGADPRARMAAIACLGMLAAAGLVGAVLLLTKDGVAQATATAAHPRPVASRATTLANAGAPAAPRARITATPLPPRPPSFRVLVASEPSGAQTWVEGEDAPRGRTPVDLVFTSTVPRTVRLKAPGFRSQTLLVSPGGAAVARARLVPEPLPGSGAREKQPAAPARNNLYQAVGD
jgi:serine/threonine protein kinase